MLNFLICIFLSMVISFGLSIALVEKSKTWPIRSVRIRLQLLLSKIHWRLPQMLFCTTCCSFWADLGINMCLFVITTVFFGFSYFFWPFSGFITLGFTWFIIEFLNAIDKKQPIINNNYIIQQEKNDNILKDN